MVEFAKTLSLEDEVVLEATGNSAAVERLLRPHVKRVAIANPRLVRAIAYARVKTDKIDAAILAKLHAAGFLPEVWVADDDTYGRRRQTAERMGVLEQRVRIKGRIQAILHANLIPTYKGHLFGKTGRKWLDGLPLPKRSEPSWRGSSRSSNGSTASSPSSTRSLAQQALADPRALRLMTIPGVSSVVASTVLASIGDITRFPSPDKLSSYFGLTPRSGSPATDPARHGRISKQGNTARSQDAGRGGLVGEDRAWSAAGLLRSRPEEARRPAAAVATARKLAVMIWHVLAEREGIRVRAAGLHGHEAAQGGAQGRRPTRVRQGWARPRLLDQGDPPAGERLRRACRAGLRTDGRRLEGAADGA